MGAVGFNSRGDHRTHSFEESQTSNVDDKGFFNISRIIDLAGKFFRRLWEFPKLLQQKFSSLIGRVRSGFKNLNTSKASLVSGSRTQSDEYVWHPESSDFRLWDSEGKVYIYTLLRNAN